jgi:hypothetical protein
LFPSSTRAITPEMLVPSCAAPLLFTDSSTSLG